MKKRIVTQNEIKEKSSDNMFYVRGDMIITPLVKEFAESEGIKIIYESRNFNKAKSNNPAMVDDLTETITKEVISYLSNDSQAKSNLSEPKQMFKCAECKDQRRKSTSERAVVTSTGANSIGVVYKVTKAIAECNGDIHDISQTIISDFFTMIIVIDISNMKKSGTSFEQFKNQLLKVGDELNIKIMVQHENILQSMHRI